MKYEHVKCSKCKKMFLNNADFAVHTDSQHKTFKCDICQQEIPVESKKQHTEYHIKVDMYKEALENGKISKTKPKEMIDMKEAWSNYQGHERSIVRELISKKNPGIKGRALNSLILKQMAAKLKFLSMSEK